MSEFKDKAGYFVEPGDFIIYAVSYGRSPGLCYGRVLAVTDKSKLKVIGCDTGWGSDKFRMNSKPGFLSYSSRILGVEANQVPQEIREQLLAYKESQ